VAFGGERPPLGGPRPRAVLVDLALHAGRVVSLAQLVDDLWGDSPPASAPHTIAAYVSRLRRVLHVPGQAAVLRTAGAGYLLDVDPSDVDALHFAALAAQGRAARDADDKDAAERLLSSALALWRGPALADVRDTAFAPGAAQRLENDRLDVAETRVDIRLQLGHHGDLVSELETAIAADPLRERFHAQLMTALYRAGRQADALAAFHRARRRLGDLGLEPGRELRQLEHAILIQAPELHLAKPGPASEHHPKLAGPTGSPADPVRLEPAITPLPRPQRRQKWAIGASLALIAVGLVAVTAPRFDSRAAAQALASVGVSELTAASGNLSRSVSLPGDPGGAVSGVGSVWVDSPEADVLDRIDPATGGIVDTIPVGAGAGALAVTGSDVWVANTLDGTLSRVSAVTDEVVQTVAVRSEPTGLAVGDGSVWVADSAGDALVAVDASSGRLRSTDPVPSAPFGVAFGAGSLWLTRPGGNDVVRVSPKGGPGMPIPVGAGPGAVAFGLGSLWVANGLDSTVSRVDPTTDKVTATIPVGDGPDALTIQGDTVWVANRVSSTLTRIDAASDRAARSIPVGASPIALCATGGHIWAATETAVTSRPTSGVLHVVSSVAQPTIDPAFVYPNAPFQFFEGTYDMLVTYQRVGGGAGLQLVPDLAAAMPSVTAGGTVYTFTLRPGLRYSDGRPVRPEDFRYGLERVMQDNASEASFLTGIIGAASCRINEPCDLIRGITASDRADTVSFHLRAPDPDFLYKVVISTIPVPPDVPDHDIGTKAVPSTGPDMIGRFVPGREVDFVRNPYFREWSAAAEPGGFPGRIVWTFGASIPQEITEIEAGTADWTDDTVPDVAQLIAQYPAQVHVNPVFGIDYAAFNTRVAPFDHQSVRQAFSLAANRMTLVDQLGGPSAANPTCQILPPGIPGYERYCPFTVDATPGGAWVGPDLTAARRLVAESRTAGMRVTIMSQQGSGSTGTFMVSVLDQLGYRAALISAPPAIVERDTSDSRRRIQATDGQWNSDYPSPSDSFDLFFRCSSFRLADPAATRNGSFFCDPAIDRLMDVADQQMFTDPARADATWAAVDRRVTDAAPWVALVNPEGADFLSGRVSNYQYNSAVGMLLDQLSVGKPQRSAHANPPSSSK
jgi:YVTN family beta-propeller protein